MGPQYNVEQLIENIKRRCSVPTSQLTFTDEDFALLANDELHGEVVPLMMSTREEYFVEWYEVNTPADGVISFPDDTVASKVRTVAYRQPGSPLVMNNLPRIDLDIVTGVGFANFNTLAGFYVQGNDLVLYPNTSVPVGTPIRIYFYKRPLVLAAPSQYGQIESIDVNTNQITLSYVPYDWTTGTVLNAVSSTPGFKVTASALTIVSTSAPSITLDTVDGLSVGDYVSNEGYSAVPQVPIEAHAYLAQLTAAKCLEALGDNVGNQAALAKAESLKKNLLIMLSQRVDGSTKKVMSPSGGMRVGAGIGRWGWGWSGGSGTW